MIVLGIDPGKNTGFYACEYDVKSNEFAHRHVSVTRSLEEAAKQIQMLGEKLKPDVWVVEDYVINPRNAKGPVYNHTHTNDSGDALRVIGFAQMEAYRQGAMYHMQMPSIKPVGYGFLGEKYQRGKKEQHAKDAKVHAVYYLVTKWRMNPMLCRTTQKPSSAPSESSLPKFHLEFDS